MSNQPAPTQIEKEFFFDKIQEKITEAQKDRFGVELNPTNFVGYIYESPVIFYGDDIASATQSVASALLEGGEPLTLQVWRNDYGVREYPIYHSNDIFEVVDHLKNLPEYQDTATDISPTKMEAEIVLELKYGDDLVAVFNPMPEHEEYAPLAWVLIGRYCYYTGIARRYQSYLSNYDEDDVNANIQTWLNYLDSNHKLSVILHEESNNKFYLKNGVYSDRFGEKFKWDELPNEIVEYIKECYND